MLDMEACKRSRKVENAPLDASIWGHLQDYIDLEAIYSKLPRLELLRLRLVCKAWNQAADRTLEPRPFFPIIVAGCPNTQVDAEYLNGLLSYDSVSQSYSFKRQPFVIPNVFPYSPFAVEGLIFCHHPANLSETGVFNIHNLTWHSISDLSERGCAVGMLVDTSVRPHSFKLVVGSLEENTRIYDSTTRAWSVMSSRLQQAAGYALSYVLNGYETVTCMCVNNSVWISVGAEILLVYSMERDVWKIMDTPEVEENADEHGVHALSAWDGRIFTAREDWSKGRVTVWELVDEAKAEWAEYVAISGNDYWFLFECPFGSHGPSIYEEMQRLPCFCDGYLLLYSWHYSYCRSYARGMLNLATCEWEKVTLPPRTMAFEKKTEDDREGSGIFEEDSEEDSEEDRGCGSSGDSGHECIRRAIRIRRNQSCAKVNVRSSTGPDKTEARGVGHGCDIAPQAEKLPASVAQPSPVCKNPVTFECAMCFFECDVLDEYVAHKRTKTHGIIEELQQQKNKLGVNPLTVLNNYASSNHLQANYEYKDGEMIATVGTRGSPGDSHVKGVARYRKRQKAKHMAAAAVLEKVLETYDPESKFAKYLHKLGLTNWNLGNRDPNDGGNKGGCSNEGNKGGSSIGAVGGKVGNIGGNVGSNSSQGVGATVGGIFIGNVDNVVGNPCGSGGNGSEDGGVGKAGGICEGVGNNLSNPNALPVPGYNKYISFAGSRGDIDVEKQGGTSQVAVPASRPKLQNEKKLEKLTERGIQGGNAGFMPKPAPALGHSSHPEISAYGRPPRGPVMPHNGGHAQHMPNPIMVSRTHHYISMETFYTQQTAPWVGGPGQGGIPYPLYGMAPGVSPGTMVQPYMQQYAPPPINYGAYGPSQEFAVNTVQEMAPRTSTSAHSTLVAQYGMMPQPQQQVPQQHPGYPLHPGDVPRFFGSSHIV